MGSCASIPEQGHGPAPPTGRSHFELDAECERLHHEISDCMTTVSACEDASEPSPAARAFAQKMTVLKARLLYGITDDVNQFVPGPERIPPNQLESVAAWEKNVVPEVPTDPTALASFSTSTDDRLTIPLVSASSGDSTLAASAPGSPLIFAASTSTVLTSDTLALHNAYTRRA